MAKRKAPVDRKAQVKEMIKEAVMEALDDPEVRERITPTPEPEPEPEKEEESFWDRFFGSDEPEESEGEE